jgi:polysaccharide pyruvyl transferase WcaK-like protein
VRSTQKPPKVSIYGHFGTPNPGNEGTLLAILTRLRSIYPGSQFRCICTFPEVVAERDGIEAVPITTRDARIWDRSLPLSRRIPTAFGGLAAELGQYVRAFNELKGTDFLIIPGTGLVTDAFSLAGWGLYNQFKWVAMAKLRRCKVLYVSIGAGPIDGAAGRALAKAAFSLADYRSYRDDSSRDWLRRIGFSTRRDHVYPDLVFGLPDALLPHGNGRAAGKRRVVGLGLMVYTARYSATEPRPETYSTYLESLAEFATWLLEHDYDIRLLLGDGDKIVIDEFRSVLQSRLGGYDEGRIVEQPIDSVDDVLTEIAATDVVVATRFHNVIMAMMLGKPVIAISFHHKCASLMREMQLAEYCHDIHEMDVERLIGQFEKLEERRDEVRLTIDHGVGEARAAVDEQYDRLFARPAHA